MIVVLLVIFWDYNKFLFSSSWSLLLCASCAIQGIHVKCCMTDTDAASALPENWECDICTLVSQRQKERNDEMDKKGKVVLPEGTYDRLVQQCRRGNNFSINLKRL